MTENILVILFVAVPAIILHEFAHGWAALCLGDSTARSMGRLTLNPLKHIDPVGTLLIPGLLYASYALGWTHSLLMFGWAKPVPVNFSALRFPRRDMILVALAGPLVNILLALLMAQILRLGWMPRFSMFFFYGVLLNLGLAIFNLLPIPPLDGSRIVSGCLPRAWAREYSRLEPFGFLVLILLLNFGGLSFVSRLVMVAFRILGL